MVRAHTPSVKELIKAAAVIGCSEQLAVVNVPSIEGCFKHRGDLVPALSDRTRSKLSLHQVPERGGLGAGP